MQNVSNLVSTEDRQAPRHGSARALRSVPTVALLLASACAAPLAGQGVGWKLLSGPMEGRSDHAAAFDASRGRLVLFGGVTENGVSNETWERAGTQWTRAWPKASPPAMPNADMVYHDANKRVYLAGSTNASTPGRLWSYDGTTWTDHGPTPARYGALTYDSKQRRLLYAEQGLWSFDGRTWTRITSSGPKVSAGLAAYDRKRDVLVVAMRNDYPWDLDIHEWNGSTWSTKRFYGEGRTQHKVRFVNGALTIGPGTTASCDRPANFLVWNGTNLLPTNTDARFAYALGPNGVHGGKRPVYDGLGCKSYRVWRASDPNPHSGFAMCYDPKRKDLTIGFGHDLASGGPYSSYLRAWNGTAWRTTPRGPEARSNATMTYDPSRDEFVVFGGSGSTDTWIRSGALTWQKISLAKAPPRRLLHGAAYLPKSKRVFLHGGYDNYRPTKILTDTWAWDGGTRTWALLSTQAPAVRRVVMTADTKRDRLVMVALGSIWEFVGNRWTRVLTQPALDSVTNIAYDESRARSVLFSRSSVLEWNGSTLLERVTLRGTVPPMEQAVYDPDRRAIVTYRGGSDIWAFGATTPTLTRDTSTISLASGGTQRIAIDAGAQNARQLYLVLGSLSGNAPGFSIGSVHVPLNIDAYTDFTLQNPNNGRVHIASFGALDANGRAGSTLTLPAGLLPPTLIGARMHHAAVVFGAPLLETASNDVFVDLIR